MAMVGLAAMLSTASLLTAVRHALARREKVEPTEEESRATEIAYLREVAGDALSSIDLRKYPPELQPRPDLPDRDAVRRTMPVLHPPLSQTVSDDRDESGY